MVTAEEIARIPLFASLGADDREQLSRAAADISLVPGEYAAAQGSERALFAVLEGRIEAVRIEDGIERVVGERQPGEIFGEVPITLGTVFPVGFRAAVSTRVMCLDPHDYHAVAAKVPELVKKVGELAAHRMTGAAGLQGLAAEQAPRAIILGGRLDPACAELRRFLEGNQIRFRSVEHGDSDAGERWLGPLPPEVDCPAIQVVDGGTLLRPGLRDVAELLRLRTRPAAVEYDTVIVGGGPAGMAAAVYGASEGLRTIVGEQEAPGGQAGTSSHIANYLGFPNGVSGRELASRALRQAKELGAEIVVTRKIERIDPATREVHLDGGDVLRGQTIILACGVSWRRLSVEGFDRLAGKGVFYGAARSEAASAHGQDVHVVGAGNSAGQAAIFFGNHARSVTICCRSDELGKSMSRYLVEQVEARPNIRVLTRTEVVAAEGDQSIEAIVVRNSETGEDRRMTCGGLFIFIGADAETGWLPDEIARDPKGYVLTGSDVTAEGRWELDRDPYLLETSVPGVFACGDVRFGPVKRVAAAVGEGSMAIAFVHQYLRDAAAQPLSHVSQ